MVRLWTLAAVTAVTAALFAVPAQAAPTVDAGTQVAPYIDITMPTPSLVDVANATGVKTFTLAFALADSTGCNPSWGGTIPLDDSRVLGEIHDLQAMGGNVIVATGGAAGPYLEYTCGSADALAGAYRTILDTVGTNSLDVDIEATIPQDTVNAALAQVQQERGTTISYTLRVQGDDYGVDPYSLDVVKSAQSHGVNVLVNPMTMEFGTTQADWGDAVIAAAESTVGQMRGIWTGESDAQLYARLGVTPMIGRNYSGKIFQLDDAAQLVSWAHSKGVARLAFWSAGRDNGSCPGGGVSATCSSIEQADYAFTTAFNS